MVSDAFYKLMKAKLHISREVFGHLSSPHKEIAADSKQNAFTSQCLAPSLGLLLAGTRQGSVQVFRWPEARGRGLDLSCAGGRAVHGDRLARRWPLA